jgi:hypothetical protein
MKRRASRHFAHHRHDLRSRSSIMAEGEAQHVSAVKDQKILSPAICLEHF